MCIPPSLCCGRPCSSVYLVLDPLGLCSILFLLHHSSYKHGIIVHFHDCRITQIIILRLSRFLIILEFRLAGGHLRSWLRLLCTYRYLSLLYFSFLFFASNCSNNWWWHTSWARSLCNILTGWSLANTTAMFGCSSWSRYSLREGLICEGLLGVFSCLKSVWRNHLARVHNACWLIVHYSRLKHLRRSSLRGGRLCLFWWLFNRRCFKLLLWITTDWLCLKTSHASGHRFTLVFLLFLINYGTWIFYSPIIVVKIILEDLLSLPLPFSLLLSVNFLFFPFFLCF